MGVDQPGGDRQRDVMAQRGRREPGLGLEVDEPLSPDQPAAGQLGVGF
jgi:hypothetical protein